MPQVNFNRWTYLPPTHTHVQNKAPLLHCEGRSQLSKGYGGTVVKCTIVFSVVWCSTDIKGVRN
jgi:hypothetical protein